MQEYNDKYLINIQRAKSGQNYISINGKQICSSVNPSLEAEKFIEHNKEVYTKKNNILVLGLGAGYHIKELLRKMKNIYDHDFLILVVEPHALLVENFLKNNSLNKNLIIFNDQDIQKIYDNTQFIDFLKKIPGVIIHNASFNTQNDFYSTFLKYRCENLKEEMINTLEHQELKNYFQNNEFVIYNDLISNLRSSNNDSLLSKYDFFLLAFDSI